MMIFPCLDFILNNVKIIYNNTVSELSKLAEDVAFFGLKNQLDEATIYNINLCVEEILVNIIRYGFADKSYHPIEVDMECQEKRIKITIKDEGLPFNPLKDAPAPSLHSSLAERPEGGLGVFLLKELMDDLSYKREGSSNILTMLTSCA